MLLRRGNRRSNTYKDEQREEEVLQKGKLQKLLKRRGVRQQLQITKIGKVLQRKYKRKRDITQSREDTLLSGEKRRSITKT